MNKKLKKTSPRHVYKRSLQLYMSREKVPNNLIDMRKAILQSLTRYQNPKTSNRDLSLCPQNGYKFIYQDFSLTFLICPKEMRRHARVSLVEISTLWIAQNKRLSLGLK